ncbi:MAG: hypothetical protein PHT19_17630 [Methylococcus sp.]|nr:hypothetical protein [Methylococcus sp.]
MMATLREQQAAAFWVLMQDIASIKRMPTEEVDADLEDIEESDDLDDECELIPEGYDNGI